MDDMQVCSYDGKEYPASQFDEHGVHKGHRPRHYVTGELVETGIEIGHAGRGRRGMVFSPAHGPLGDSPVDPR